MNIGIDIDDTIVINSNYFLSHILEEDLPEYILIEIKNNITNIMDGKIPAFLMPYLAPIYKKYNLLYEVYPNVVPVLERLKRENKIIIATGRCNEMLEGCEDTTIQYLDMKGITYDEIYYGVSDKLVFCLEHDIDVFIDDSVNHIGKISSAGIPTILFESEVNKNFKIRTLKSNNWLDVEKKINNLKN